MRILVLRYRFIGDTILAVPFLRNLRRAMPDAIIDLVLAPLSGDVLKGIPYVDNIFYWDPVTIHSDCQGQHKGLISKWRFIRDLRSNKYSKVYVLKRSFSSALIAFLTGAGSRIGFRSEGRGALLTNTVEYQGELHEVENFLNCLKCDGIEVIDSYLEAWVSENERIKASEFLRDQGIDPITPLIAIHPFSAVEERSWPLSRFIEVSNHLSKEYNCPVLWLGGNRDRSKKDMIMANSIGKTVMAIGVTGIRESMALLSFAGLFIGNDSGIMHLAAAINVPLVAIFGPQSVKRFGPWSGSDNSCVITKNLPCHPCKQKFFTECMPGREGRPICLESISIEDVLTACHSICGKGLIPAIVKKSTQ